MGQRQSLDSRAIREGLSFISLGVLKQNFLVLFAAYIFVAAGLVSCEMMAFGDDMVFVSWLNSYCYHLTVLACTSNDT
jgi:hypothetical protein